MPIRPVDMQVATTRTADVSKMQAEEGKNPEMMQQQFASQLEKEVEVEISTVYEAKKNEKTALDNEREGDGKKESSEQKKKEEKKKKDNIPAAYRDGGSLVDIKA